MTVSKRQAGLSLTGILVFIALFSFFLTISLRLIPHYMEGRKIKAAVSHVAESVNSAQSLREINKRIQSVFITNMVEGIEAKEVKVYRENNMVIIDANYEARTNLFKGIDVVLIFDDLKFEVK